jgi:alkylhydroperoxidase family enzyme
VARVPYIEKESAAGDVRKLYDSFEKDFSTTVPNMSVPNVFKALANSPGLAARVYPLADYFMHQSSLSPRVRELAVLMLMKRLNCEYGFVNHLGIAKGVGITQQQIDDIDSYQASSTFNEDDKLVLRYAEDLTMKARIDDDLYRRVEQRLGKSNVLELTTAVSCWNMMGRNLNALQIDLEK